MTSPSPTHTELLPPATARALIALDAAPEKKIAFQCFRKACDVQIGGYYLFVSKLLKKNLIVEVGDLSRTYAYSITFAGMQALAAHRAALAAEARS